MWSNKIAFEGRAKKRVKGEVNSAKIKGGANLLLEKNPRGERYAVLARKCSTTASSVTNMPGVGQNQTNRHQTYDNVVIFLQWTDQMPSGSKSVFQSMATYVCVGMWTLENKTDLKLDDNVGGNHRLSREGVTSKLWGRQLGLDRTPWQLPGSRKKWMSFSSCQITLSIVPVQSSLHLKALVTETRGAIWSWNSEQRECWGHNWEGRIKHNRHWNTFSRIQNCWFFIKK